VREMDVASGPAMRRASDARWDDARDLRSGARVLTCAHVAAAIVVALAIRLYHLGYAPLWFDEIDTAQWASAAVGEMLHTVVSYEPAGNFDPYQMPLYFIVVNLWSKIAGLSAEALRFPGALLSVATVALIAVLADALLDARAARRAAWLAAISPYLVHHAQDARMYPLLCALAAASLLLLARFLRGNSDRLGIAFVVTNVALMLTHYYAFFVIAAELATLVVVHPARKRAWVPGFAATAVAAAGLLYVALALTPHRSGDVYRLGSMAFPGAIWSVLSGYTLLPSSEELHRIGAQAARPYLPYATASGLALIAIAAVAMRRMDTVARIVVLATIASVAVGPFVAHIVFPGISVNPRYLIAGAPAFIVLLAAGMPDRLRLDGRSAATIVIVAVMIVGTIRHLSDPAQKREDVAAAGRWLRANVPVDEPVLVTSAEMAIIARYTWPDRTFLLYPDKSVVADAGNAERLAAGIPWNGRRRVLYMFGRDWVSDPDGRLQRAVIGRYAPCPGTEVRGIRLRCIRALAGG